MATVKQVREWLATKPDDYVVEIYNLGDCDGGWLPVEDGATSNLRAVSFDLPGLIPDVPGSTFIIDPDPTAATS